MGALSNVVFECTATTVAAVHRPEQDIFYIHLYDIKGAAARSC